MTTWEYAHARGRGVARSLGDWARTRRLGQVVRQMFWPVAGVACLVGAAFTVSLLAGLVAAGLGCFFCEWRFAK